MQIFREIKPNMLSASCLALGMFDGAHIGHQKVILNAVKKAEEINAISTVVTFARHPMSVTSKTKTKFITTLDDKLEIISNLGVQAAVVLDFNKEFSQISAEDYLKSILIEALNAKSITTGYNHHFGAGKKGNINLLKEFSQIYGYEVSIVQPVKLDDHVISSSAVRKLISAGNVELAAKMLGRTYSIRGKVIKGKQRGRLLGFPTANLTIPEDIISPDTGVYSGIVNIDGKDYPSVINLGKRPTYADIEENLIEAHVLNFSGNLYDKIIKVSFSRKLRDEKKFNSEKELIDQIKKDCCSASAVNA